MLELKRLDDYMKKDHQKHFGALQKIQSQKSEIIEYIDSSEVEIKNNLNDIKAICDQLAKQYGAFLLERKINNITLSSNREYPPFSLNIEIKPEKHSGEIRYISSLSLNYNHDNIYLNSVNHINDFIEDIIEAIKRHLEKNEPDPDAIYTFKSLKDLNKDRFIKQLDSDLSYTISNAEKDYYKEKASIYKELQRSSVELGIVNTYEEQQLYEDLEP